MQLEWVNYLRAKVLSSSNVPSVSSQGFNELECRARGLGCAYCERGAALSLQVSFDELSLLSRCGLTAVTL